MNITIEQSQTNNILVKMASVAGVDAVFINTCFLEATH
jgi:hypothetical protein